MSLGALALGGGIHDNPARAPLPPPGIVTQNNSEQGCGLAEPGS